MGALTSVLAGSVWLALWWRGSAARATESWLPVPCVITHAAVHETITPTETGHSRRYDVEVSFRYSVGGREFTGSRYAVVHPSLLKLAAEDIVARLPAGSETTCYYDPAQPEESVLVRGDLTEGGAGILMAGLLFVISLVLLAAGATARLRGG